MQSCCLHHKLLRVHLKDSNAKPTACAYILVMKNRVSDALAHLTYENVLKQQNIRNALSTDNLQIFTDTMRSLDPIFDNNIKDSVCIRSNNMNPWGWAMVSFLNHVYQRAQILVHTCAGFLPYTRSTICRRVLGPTPRRPPSSASGTDQLPACGSASASIINSQGSC